MVGITDSEICSMVWMIEIFEERSFNEDVSLGIGVIQHVHPN